MSAESLPPRAHDADQVQRDLGLIDPAARASWIVPEDVIAKAPADFRRSRVGIVGGGIAGLTCAYILTLLGMDFTLFEAGNRWGGRVWTLRSGDVVTDTSGVTQQVRFPDGAYADAGATRIHPHMVTMHYAQRLGVALEPFIARNDDALVAAPDGDRWRRARFRDVRQDLRERLVVDGRDDTARLFAGAGSPSSARRSLWNLADAGDPGARPGRRTSRIPDAVLRGPVGRALVGEMSALKSGTLLRPRGGADALVNAMVARLKPGALKLNHTLVRLTQDRSRVYLAVRERDGAVRQHTFDHVVLAAPPHLLAPLAGDLPGDVRAALRVPQPRPAVKTFVGYADRWWERRLGIYGGTSFAAHPVEKIWYPSTGFGDRGGVLTAYSLKENAAYLGALDVAERCRRTVDCLVGMHGPMAAPGVIGMTSVSWLDVPYIQGAWVNWPSYEHPAFHRLGRGVGRVQFAGDWLSPLTAWQAGAYESAAQALLRLTHHCRAEER